MSWKTLLKRWLSPSNQTISKAKPSFRKRLELEQLEDRTVMSVVSVTANPNMAYETGSQSGSFAITRTGDMSTSLMVYFQMSGTATNGVDYSLTNSVMIPTGMSYAMLPLTPMQDALVEGNENAILTIVPNAAYGIGTGSATITIVDAAPPPPPPSTVTIAATDPNASEVGPDSGMFTISRSGV